MTLTNTPHTPTHTLALGPLLPSITFATVISGKQRHPISGVSVIGQPGKEKSAKCPRQRCHFLERGQKSNITSVYQPHPLVSAFPKDLTIGNCQLQTTVSCLFQPCLATALGGTRLSTRVEAFEPMEESHVLQVPQHRKRAKPWLLLSWGHHFTSLGYTGTIGQK